MKPTTSSGHAYALLFAICLATALVSAPAFAAATAAADHLFFGKHILTMEADYERGRKARVSALAVRGEQIVWMGGKAEAKEFIGPDTQVHELGDQALLPGFIDAHGHVSFLGATLAWANLAPPPVGPVTDFETLEETLSQYIETHQVPPGSWVIGFGYDDSLMEEQDHPDRRVLDAVSAEHPIALTHVSGHLMAANSLALEQAGIDSETVDPAGGHIRRFPGTSEPTGVLEETAAYPVRAHLMQPRGNPLEDLGHGLAAYASNGVTTVQEGYAQPASVQLLKAAAEAGTLNLDVIVYPGIRSNDLTAVDGIAFGRYQNRLKFGGVKISLDGSPQGKTAYLTKPYHVPPPGQSAGYRGYPTYKDEQVNAMFAAYLDARIPILAHANGDAAADQLITAVEKAAPTADHRTVMIHAQTVREDQLDAMKELGIVPSFFSAHTFYWGDWHRDSVLGPERGSRISPTRSAWDRGMKFTVHNDAPVVPPDMIRLLWATTNRETRSGVVLGKEQRLSIFEALSTVTRMAAYQNFEEAQKGTLSVGKLADLVVLSSNPLRLAPGDLLDLEVEETWSRGRRIFTAESEDN